jgi:hypothetical protein
MQQAANPAAGQRKTEHFTGNPPYATPSYSAVRRTGAGAAELACPFGVVVEHDGR